MKKILAALATTAALTALAAPASAASIPYPNVGSYNTATYTFEVAHTGDVKLYFAGASAGNNNSIEIAINGSSTSGLFPDHSTSVGTMYDFGSFTKGQVVTFTLDTNGTFFSSNPALNVGLDGSNPINDQHIYATEYNHHAAGWNLPKSGLFLAFEDLPLTSSDRDFNDETFVATNIKIANPCGGVPEPATWTALIVGFAGIGAAMRRKSSAASFAALS